MRYFPGQWFRNASVCLAVAICAMSFCTISSAEESASDLMSVQGTGYPPIKAESAAQAHLMARRAAVVNAYRNALAGSPSGSSNEVTYQELSGFVSGLTVVEEEYLKDGGIRITAKVPKRNIVVSAGRAAAVRKAEQSGGPESVSLDEWYKIIKDLVKIDK